MPDKNMDPISTIVGTALTIGSAIAARNQQLINQSQFDRSEIIRITDQIVLDLNNLSLIRDGLLSEKIHLLGIKAIRNQGMGLFKSRRLKRNQIKTHGARQIMNSHSGRVEALTQEIDSLAREVHSLRVELGIRNDEPLTRIDSQFLESGITSGGIENTNLLLGGFVLITVLVLVVRS